MDALARVEEFEDAAGDGEGEGEIDCEGEG